MFSGLWCADRAALYALVEVEKLKKKTAYDRHYLLLCMIFTVMARIRCVSCPSQKNLSAAPNIIYCLQIAALYFIAVLEELGCINTDTKLSLSLIIPWIPREDFMKLGMIFLPWG